MPTEPDIAYIAGIIDGEGCVRVKKIRNGPLSRSPVPKYQAVVQVRMVDESAISFIAEKLGGGYYQERNSQKPNRRRLFCYSVSDAAAEKIITTLLPYLKVKREQANNIIAFRTHQRTSLENRTKITGYFTITGKYGQLITMPKRRLNDIYIEKCETFYVRSRFLNRVGDIGGGD